ncbi:hypothetical protein EB796_012179 [Bugula neritina]|uniref:Uncharacterized protein n=1 Tax=Bugula neritina TaxID=10212 RepID=A0A7J7JSZ4_BUGNE|nr:hypothetical protein EB796_012179 [Bugula neritina]
MKLLLTTLAVTLLLTSIYDGVTARRGGGSSGGRGGSAGSRGGSSRSSAARVSGGYSGSGYRSAVAAGFYVGGVTRYRTRFYGTSHYKAEPPICYTTNSSVVDLSNTTKKGAYFVCPYWPTDKPDYVYCCGPSDTQRCCTFWEDPGRLAGAIIGFILLGITVFVVVPLIIYCCCCRKKKSSVDKQHVGYEAQDQSIKY